MSLVDLTLSPSLMLVTEINKANDLELTLNDVSIGKPIEITGTPIEDVVIDGVTYTVQRNTAIDVELKSSELGFGAQTFTYQRINLTKLFSECNPHMREVDLEDHEGAITAKVVFAEVLRKYGVAMEGHGFQAVVTPGRVRITPLPENIAYIGSVLITIDKSLESRLRNTLLDGFEHSVEFTIPDWRYTFEFDDIVDDVNITGNVIEVNGRGPTLITGHGPFEHAVAPDDKLLDLSRKYLKLTDSELTLNRGFTVAHIFKPSTVESLTFLDTMTGNGRIWVGDGKIHIGSPYGLKDSFPLVIDITPNEWNVCVIVHGSQNTQVWINKSLVLDSQFNSISAAYGEYMYSIWNDVGVNGPIKEMQFFKRQLDADEIDRIGFVA